VEDSACSLFSSSRKSLKFGSSASQARIERLLGLLPAGSDYPISWT
jgi:hypothetical protein